MSIISRNKAQSEFSLLLQPTEAFLILSYAIAGVSFLLNGNEIRLIVKKIKKATDFEIVLLNLAIADLLNSVLFIVAAVITQKSTHRKEGQLDYAFYWVSGVLTFSVISSVSFVAVIGIERFLAIKLPLQHRMWHSNRGRLVKYIVFTWLFDVILIMVPLVIEYLQDGRESNFPSNFACYLIAGVLGFGSVIIIVLYTWVLHLMMLRSLKLFDFGKKILRVNRRMMKEAMKKEKPSIIICFLVVVSFLACNLPLAIDLFQLQLTLMPDLLLRLSGILNSLIYFFKGYLEKYYTKNKLGTLTHEGDSSQEKKNRGKSSNEIQPSHALQPLR